MASIPTKRELGPLAQLASRPQFQPAQSFAGEALSGLGRDLNNAGGAALDYATQNAKEIASVTDRAQRYDTQNAFDKFEADQARKVDDAILNAQPGAGGLSDAYGKQFDTDWATFKKSVPPRLQAQIDGLAINAKTRLTTRARDFEVKERSRFENANMDETVDRKVLEAASDPSNPAVISASRQSAEQFIKANPYLRPIEKDVRLRSLDDKFAVGVGNAINANPEANAKVFSKGPKSDGARVGQAMTFFQERGYTRDQAAGIVGNLMAESSLNTGARNPGDGSDGTDSIGIAQWNSGRAVALKQFAADHGADWRDFGIQLAFVDHELKTSHKSIGDRLRSSGDVVSAAEAGIMFEGPAGSDKGPRNAHNYAGRVANARRAAGLPPGAGGDVETEYGASGDPTMGEAQTFFAQEFPNASAEVVQSLAERAVNARLGFIKSDLAALTQQSQSQQDSFQLRIATADPTLTTQDILSASALDNGQKATLLNSLNSAQKQQRETLAQVQALTSSDAPLNPLDSDVQKGVDAATASMVQANPQAAPQIYEQAIRRGVIPKAVSNTLLNNAYSTDPAVVSQTLTQASRIQSQAPAAFDNIPNGESLRKDVASFDHMVNDRGFSADEASKRLLERRTPEFAKNAEILGPAAKKAADDITIQQVTAAFDPGAFSAEPGAGVDTGTQNVLLSQFREAFQENYIRTGGDTAEAVKLTQMDLSKTWGISETSGSKQLMQYPVEKFYPAINGSQAYLRDDAVKTASTFAGADGPSSVYLKPYIDQNGRNLTAEDVRAGRPPRYRLTYAREESGQTVIDTVPGTWAADPKELQAEAAKKAATAAVERRATSERLKTDFPPDVKYVRPFTPSGKAEAVKPPEPAKKPASTTPYVPSETSIPLGNPMGEPW